MKNNITEIIFILDRSGSMESLTMDTIGGYNSFISKQKTLEEEALVTTVLFDDEYELLHSSIPIQNLLPITTQEYFARGTTALLDAIGITINSVYSKIQKSNIDDRPSKVIFVITTDGEENSSKEFSKSQIRNMINKKTTLENWQFIFLGANINASKEAEDLGISKEHATNYTANKKGTKLMYECVSEVVSDYRHKGKINKDWNKHLK